MTISRWRLVAILGVLLLAVAACGSGTTETTADDTNTTAEAAATTAATEETSDSGSVGSFGDMPAECIEAFRAYLREIEPIVEDFDFESSTMAEFEAVAQQFEDTSTAFEEETEACPDLDLDTEESFAAMIEFAESEAPGTAGYFRFLQQFIGDGSTTGVSASGDCETDIASVQEFIDQADSIGDLTVAQTMEFSGLLGAVSAECSPERLEEFFSEEDVAAFMEDAG